MTPHLSKFMLTVHIVTSVGWPGAVAGFLALAIVSLISQDVQTVRATYLAMELTGWFVLVPLSLAALLTGIIQSLGTRWGLFRHYWLLAKLLINILAALILLVYMQTELGTLVALTTKATFSVADLGLLRGQAGVHASATLLVLLIATALSVYKPRGMTRYGQRRQREQQRTATVDAS